VKFFHTSALALCVILSNSNWKQMYKLYRYKYICYIYIRSEITT